MNTRAGTHCVVFALDGPDVTDLDAKLAKHAENSKGFLCGLCGLRVQYRGGGASVFSRSCAARKYGSDEGTSARSTRASSRRRWLMRASASRNFAVGCARLSSRA